MTRRIATALRLAGTESRLFGRAGLVDAAGLLFLPALLVIAQEHGLGGLGALAAIALFVTAGWLGWRTGRMNDFVRIRVPSRPGLVLARWTWRAPWLLLAGIALGRMPAFDAPTGISFVLATAAFAGLARSFGGRHRLLAAIALVAALLSPAIALGPRPLAPVGAFVLALFAFSWQFRLARGPEAGEPFSRDETERIWFTAAAVGPPAPLPASHSAGGLAGARAVLLRAGFRRPHHAALNSLLLLFYPLLTFVSFVVDDPSLLFILIAVDFQAMRVRPGILPGSFPDSRTWLLGSPLRPQVLLRVREVLLFAFLPTVGVAGALLAMGEGGPSGALPAAAVAAWLLARAGFPALCFTEAMRSITVAYFVVVLVVAGFYESIPRSFWAAAIGLLAAVGLAGLLAVGLGPSEETLLERIRRRLAAGGTP